MAETKHVRKTFFAWQEKREAAWLATMSAEGWHLSSVGFLNYTFTKGTPEVFIYQFDFVALGKKDEPEYLQVYTDAGWEMIGKMAAWYYFRKPASAGGSLTIYTDTASLEKKYRRLFGFILLVTFPIFYQLFIWPRYYLAESSLNGSPFYVIIRILLFLVAGLAAAALTRIALYIRELRKDDDHS
jgi:hypothetical protein